jgi:hypothetical protein
MNQNVDLVGVIFDCIIIARCVFVLFIPLNKKRIRESWASCLLVATGFIGIVNHFVQLALHIHWRLLGKNADFISTELRFVGGILVGFLFALFFSGQLNGTKRPSQVLA